MSINLPSSLVERLRTARRVVVSTGAGVSAESNIPTFRDAQTGLWAQYSPEELATPQAFSRQPALVWEWYAWRRELCAKSAPNAGHYALVTLAQKVPVLTLITQNVDDLHRKAGSRDIIELHGNIFRVKCASCGETSPAKETAPGEEVPPRCRRCAGMLRPDVVWFGEPLPMQALRAAEEAARQCDIFFSIGTSGMVQPAASLPYAVSKDAIRVEVNPQRTPLSDDMHFVLQAPSGIALPALFSAAWPD